MKIETFDREDHQKLITAEIDPEALEQFRHQAARKMSTQVKIPGFRPGKAPFDVVRRLLGDKAIEEEAITLMLDDIYPQIIQESGIDPFGPGKLEEVIQADPPKFSFLVPLMPTVEMGDYLAIRQDHTPPVVTDEKVDDIIHRLQRRSSITKPVERAAAEGDLVYLTLSGKVINAVEGEDSELIPETSRQMIAGDPRDFTDGDGNEWPFDGFSNRLVGLSAGQLVTFEYTFPDNDSNDDLNGKESVFNISVSAVHEVELHPLDDEFAQSMGQQYDTVETLRKAIQADVLNEETTRYNKLYIEGLIEQIVALASVKYPPQALEDETNHVITHFEERLSQDNLDLDTYLKTRDMTREEFAQREAAPAAERNLKRDLVLEDFARRENIRISNEEVQMIYNMAQSQARQDPSLKSMARDGVSKKQVAENLARSTINEIFNQRLMNRLRNIATGKGDETPQPAFEAESDTEAEVETPVEAVIETSAAPEIEAAPADTPAEDNSQAEA